MKHFLYLLLGITVLGGFTAIIIAGAFVGQYYPFIFWIVPVGLMMFFAYLIGAMLMDS